MDDLLVHKRVKVEDKRVAICDVCLRDWPCPDATYKTRDPQPHRPEMEQEIHLHVVIKTMAPDPEKVAGQWVGRNKTFMGDQVTVYPSTADRQGPFAAVQPLDWKAGELHAD